MVDFKSGDKEGWLSLREASKKMGVSATTLRAWADDGRVPSYRTPGGHRRFRVGEPSTPFQNESQKTDTRWRLLEHSAFGRIQLAHEETESKSIAPHARSDQHGLERELIHLCTQALQKGAEQVETRANALGERHAKMNWRYGIASQRAIATLGNFRTAFVESVVEFAFGMGEPNVDELNLWLRRVNEIIDRVCVSMLEYRVEDEKTNVGK